MPSDLPEAAQKPARAPCSEPLKPAITLEDVQAAETPLEKIRCGVLIVPKVPGPRSAAQWKRRRFHGPYLAGAPCKRIVRRHGTLGVIPENWLNFRIADHSGAIPPTH